MNKSGATPESGGKKKREVIIIIWNFKKTSKNIYIVSSNRKNKH